MRGRHYHLFSCLIVAVASASAAASGDDTAALLTVYDTAEQSGPAIAAPKPGSIYHLGVEITANSVRTVTLDAVVLLIRHASRIPGPDNPQLPLSTEGEEECRRLAERLAQERLTAAHFLSSRNLHAIQTADLLQQSLGRPSATSLTTPLAALTPGSAFTLEMIAEEAQLRGVSVQNSDCTAWILHHPRLNQLSARMTSRPEISTKPSGAETVCLEATDFEAFLSGAAVERMRIQP